MPIERGATVRWAWWERKASCGVAMRGAGGSDGREPESQGGEAIDGGGDERASVGLGDPLGDAETEAGAFDHAALVFWAAVEAVEDVREGILGDTDAGV